MVINNYGKLVHGQFPSNPLQDTNYLLSITLVEVQFNQKNSQAQENAGFVQDLYEMVKIMSSNQNKNLVVFFQN